MQDGCKVVDRGETPLEFISKGGRLSLLEKWGFVSGAHGAFRDRHSVRETMCLNPSPLWCFSLYAFLVEKTAWVLRKGMDGSTGFGIMSIRAVAWVGSFSPAQLR